MSFELEGTECFIFPDCNLLNRELNCIYLDAIGKKCDECSAKEHYTEYMDWNEH